MNRKKITFAIFSIILIAFTESKAAIAQAEPPSELDVEVMILGTVHFTGGGRDVVNPAVPDYLAPEGQEEIKQLLDRLEVYAPDKIMVEINLEREEAFNQAYTSFLNGTYELDVNESEQVGMRLARRLGHEKVYAMDFSSFLDVRPALAAAEELGQSRLLKTHENIIDQIKASADQEAKLPLIDRLISMNSDEQRLQRKIFLTVAQMGSAEDPQGALQIITWWQRNLAMFARTAQRAEPGDKILIVVGNGHREILSEFFGEAPGFKLVSPLPYLEQ